MKPDMDAQYFPDLPEVGPDGHFEGDEPDAGTEDGLLSLPAACDLSLLADADHEVGFLSRTSFEQILGESAPFNASQAQDPSRQIQGDVPLPRLLADVEYLQLQLELVRADASRQIRAAYDLTIQAQDEAQRLRLENTRLQSELEKARQQTNKRVREEQPQPQAPITSGFNQARRQNSPQNIADDEGSPVARRSKRAKKATQRFISGK